MKGVKAAFTLVELLVVIAIVALLMGLIFPAVQAVRETARRTQCANHVSQLVKAALAHETTHGFFPSGGWGYFWIGDADRGFGKTQPGGYLYSCLPYLEQAAVWTLPTDGDVNAIGAAQLAGGNRLVRTLLPTVTCPSRRENRLLPKPVDGLFVANNAQGNPAGDNVAARSDYAANGGTLNVWGLDFWGGARGVLATNLEPSTMSIASTPFNGVAFFCSEVRAKDIDDGASVTYLIGERYINPDAYVTGGSPCDNETWVQGSNNDMLRSGISRPLQDTAGVDPCGSFLFGSAHPLSFCMGFADGTVRWMRYDIDGSAHAALSSRNDGAVVPGRWIR